MPTDPTIPLMSRPPQPQSPLATLAQIQQLRGMQTQQQLEQAQLAGLDQENQMRQTQMQDQQIMRQAWMDSQGDPNTFLSLASQRGASATALMQSKATMLDMQMKTAALDEKTRANLQAKNDRIQSVLTPVAGEPDPNKQQVQWDLGQQQLVREGTITQQEAQQHPYPGPDGVKTYVAQLNYSNSLMNQGKKADAYKNQQQGDLAAAQIPGKQAQSDLAVLQNAVSDLTAKPPANPVEYGIRTAQLPPAVAQKILAAVPVSQYDPQKSPAQLRMLGMTPDQQTGAVQNAQNESDTQAYRASELKQNAQRLAQSGAELALKQKEFDTKYGQGQLQSWVDQVNKNPDVFAQLPADMKLIVGAKIAQQGRTIPAQLPTEVKNQEANSMISLAHIQNLRALLNDPQLQGSIGPIMGRVSKLETTVGDTLSTDPNIAQKQQDLLTSMNYLFVREGKALFGGRPPEKLMLDLEKNSANPAMGRNFLNGSLDAAQRSAQTAVQQAQAYRYGSAAKVGTNPSATNSPLSPRIQQLRQKYNY